MALKIYSIYASDHLLAAQTGRFPIIFVFAVPLPFLRIAAKAIAKAAFCGLSRNGEQAQVSRWQICLHEVAQGDRSRRQDYTISGALRGACRVHVSQLCSSNEWGGSKFQTVRLHDRIR